jgi:release factor glutamine methyltransferase
MKYRDLYSQGIEKLSSENIPDAKVDARILLEYACKTDRNALFLHGDMEVKDEDEKTYLELLSKRIMHIPLQYLTGEQEFMGLTYKVNESVLIPRQDTECLVEIVLKHLHDGMRILDMCTGSGCILISLLHYSNDCEGVGVDLSEEALNVARDNAERLSNNGISDKMNVNFIHSDLFENIDGNFDIIVSNPPYIKTEVIKGLMPEVREYEPMMALDGMEDGLYFYRKIISSAKEHLSRGGQLFFEIGYDQGQEVSDLMRKEGYTGVEVLKDLAGLDRVVYGTFLEE